MRVYYIGLTKQVVIGSTKKPSLLLRLFILIIDGSYFVVDLPDNVEPVTMFVQGLNDTIDVDFIRSRT